MGVKKENNKKTTTDNQKSNNINTTVQDNNEFDDSNKPIYKRNIDLSPKGMSDFLGQGRLVSYLNHIITSSKKRRAALGHILFSGPPGLGKTALANSVAYEMGTNITIIMATAIHNHFDLANTLVNLNAGDILFLDEIHGLDRRIGEMFYTAIQDFKLNISDDSTIELNPFTLIGATTASGKIDLPLLERFEHRLELKRYNDDEVKSILRRAALKLNLSIDEEGIAFMAPACQGTPRTANHIMAHIRDYAINHDTDKIGLTEIKDVFSLVGIYEDGLSEKSIIYLQTLKNMSRPASTKAIAKTMNENLSYIENVIEPWLVYKGYVELTKRGRMITEKGSDLIQHIHLE